MTASLYLRLGGASGVPAVVDDAVDRHAANPTLAPRMRGLDLPQLKALGVGFLSARASGPHHDAAPQHARLTFTPTELQAVVGDNLDTLAEHGVGAAEIGEVVGLLHTLDHALDPALDRSPEPRLEPRLEPRPAPRPDRTAAGSSRHSVEIN